MSRWRGLATRVSLAMVALVGTLAAVEVGLRLLGVPGALPEPPFRASDSADPQAASQPAIKALLHPYRGWSGVPAFQWREDREDPKRNVFGLASTLRDYRQLNRDDFVVGIFGGSVALHVATKSGDALAERLTQAYPQLEGRIRIVNAAEGAYKQPQQLMLLSELLVLGVPFDVVVNLDGFNEAALGFENAVAGVHPAWPHYRQIEGLLKLGAESPSEEDLLTTARIIALRRRAAARRRWLERSSLAELHLARLWGVRDLQRSLDEATQAELELSERRGGGSILFEVPDPCLKRPFSCGRLIARVWARSSKTMDSMTRTVGAHYLHFLQPNQHLEGTKPLSTEEREQFTLPEGTWSGYRMVVPRLRRHGQQLEEEGVRFVDLTQLFSEHPETLYIDRCCHLNQRGNDLLAEAIGRYIAAEFEPSD